MRRLLSSVAVMFGVVVAGLPAAASAAPTPAPSGAGGGAAAGAKVCTITDDRLVELSGLVATDDGFVAVNDSSDLLSRRRIFFLNNTCRVVQSKAYSGNGPRDPEDLGLAPDGRTLYVADIGDNDKSRSTVGLWTMPPDGSAPPVLNRLTYPDGKHDAEALLFNGDGTPIIATREAGKAGLYSPTGPLQPGTREGVPMKKLGEVTWPRTPTVNEFLGPLAQLVITGGATAPGASRVTLRTYSDAFEWDVTGGDVVAALTKGKPRFTPLPGEPRGESIAYGPDGASFLTVSETADQPRGTKPEILRYTPSRQVANEQHPPAAPRADNPSWLDQLTLRDITYMVAGVGLLGAILVAAGVFGILRARRNPPDSDPASGESGLPGDEGPGYAPVPADPYGAYGDGGGRAGGGVYGGGASGAVYGGRGDRPGHGASGGKPAGPVYGNGSSGGGRYGGSSGAVYGGSYTGEGTGSGSRGPGRRTDDRFGR
ncbi:MAG TPA: hypothetical protein VF462_00640 [Micromonosporaceae bacterium]